MTKLEGRGALLMGLGMGAALMYLLDPDHGRRRRALVRDKVTRSAHVAADSMRATCLDLAQRTTGAFSRARSFVLREAIDDATLVERVRAKLGRLSSHPRAIDVEAASGVVTLRGPILEDEVPHLITSVEWIPGVRQVVNALDEHRWPGNVPALQGGLS